MKIRLYTLTKRSNETLQPTGDGDVKDVTLKQATSIMSPVFILSGFDVTKNYVYVPDWGRYYFVVDYKKGNNDLYEVDCSIDKGATWKTHIASYTCFVERTSDATYYNTDLKDGAISSEEKIVNVNSASTSLWAGGGVYVARVLNSTTGITTYIGRLTDFNNLFNPISDDPNILATLEAMLQYYLYNPKEYLLDCYFLPIGFSSLSSKLTLDALLAGYATTSPGMAYRWTDNSPIITDTVTLSKPTSYYSDFRESDPAFSSYEIYIPSVGSMNLPGDVIDKTLQIKYCADIITGEVSFNLLADSDLIATYHGNIKTSMQVGGIMPSGASLLSTGLMMASATTGNPGAVANLVVNGTQNIMNPPPSVNGAPGSCCGFLNEPSIIITQTNKDSADSPNTVGKPCCKNVTLGNMSGYIKCAGASISLPGTIEDINGVNELLNGGFYYT